MDRTLRVAVVIATTGRPIEIGQLLEHLQRQTYRAAMVVLSVVDESDLPSHVPTSTLIVSGEKGSSAQRNRGMELALNNSDIIAFFDDDYVPSDHALEGIVELFLAHPDVVGANGQLLADGIHSAGISYDDAVAMIKHYDETVKSGDEEELEALDGLYGCNMAFRTTAIGDIRFDEALPLYGWQEDLDFAARLLPRGRIVKATAFIGVHRGVKSSRTSGQRFGYSQVANPLYLYQKGTMRGRYALKIILKNVLANHFRVWRPEPWIDRMGRLRGNWRAFGDAVVGKAHPSRILNIDR